MELRRVSTVYTSLREQAGGVSSILWKLATVRILGPLQSHNAEHQLTLLLRITTQRPAGTRQRDVFRNLLETKSPGLSATDWSLTCRAGPSAD